MSKVSGFIIGAALVIIGIATGNPALIIQGGLMIVSNALTLLLAPKGPARSAAEMSIQLGEQPRSAIFGECAVAGSLVDGFNYGGSYGTDWEVLIIRLADHKCEALTEYYVNDEKYTFTGDGGGVGALSDKLSIWFRDDTSNVALPSVVTTQGPGWVSADVGKSGCDVIVAYKADPPDSKEPEFPGGRPRFLFVVKGKQCYDPRLDSTVTGGSGSHRWDDPATWEWSDNPSVCRYNFVRGIYAEDAIDEPTALLIGRGLSADQAPPENVFAPANLCDELVDSEKRYRVAGPVYANQSFLEVEEMFAAATGGSVVTREGSVELEPGQAKSVVVTFTDDDLLTGSKVEWNNGLLSDSSGEWVNTVVARYVEPTKKWTDFSAPVCRDSADVVADGKPREGVVTLRLVRWQKQAQRVAEIARRMGRVWGRARVKLGPRFCELEEGDWVNWQSNRRFGGGTHTFRIESYQIDEKWQIGLTLRQINSSVFSEGTFDADLTDAIPSPVPPALAAPDSGDWALTGGEVSGTGGVLPALLLTGGSTETGVEAIIFEYRVYDVGNGDEDNWLAAGTEGPLTTDKVITGVSAGVDYEVSVTYRIAAVLTPRLILGPETTSGGAAIINLIATSFPRNLTLSISSTGVVTVSTHERVYNDKVVSVTGATVTPSPAGTNPDKIGVFYDDAARLGGAVTYQYQKFTGGTGEIDGLFPSADNPARHFVCLMVVPASGSTGGGSGTGSGGGSGGPPGGGGLNEF